MRVRVRVRGRVRVRVKVRVKVRVTFSWAAFQPEALSASSIPAPVPSALAARACSSVGTWAG